MATAEAIQGVTAYEPVNKKAHELKRVLVSARKKYAVQSRLGYQDSEKAIAAKEEYTAALTQYSEYIFASRGAAAAQRIMDWEGIKIARGAYIAPALKTAAVLGGVAFFLTTGIPTDGGALAALGSKMATAAFEWGVLNGTTVIASAGLGILTRMGITHVWNKSFEKKHAKELTDAATIEKGSQARGVTFAEFRNSEAGKIIARQVRSQRWGKGISTAVGLALGVEAFGLFHHGIAKELAERFGLDHGFARILNAITNIFHSGNTVFDVATLKASLSHNMLDIGMLAGVAFDHTVGVSGTAHAHEMDMHDIHGHTPKHLNKLGGPHAFDHGKHGEALMAENIEKASRMLAEKDHWPEAQRLAFVAKAEAGGHSLVKIFYDPITKQNFVIGPDGLRKDIAIDAMVSSDGTEGPVTVPDGTQVIEVDYDYTDAAGVVHQKVAYMPLDCGNWSDGGEVLAQTPPPVEAAPSPCDTIYDTFHTDTNVLRVTIDGYPGWELDGAPPQYTDGFHGWNTSGAIMSPDGIHFSHHITVTNPDVIHAPRMMTIEDANKMLPGYLKALHEGGVNDKYFLLVIDADCDGHPEQVYCVEVTGYNADGSPIYTEAPLKVHTPGSVMERPYNGLEKGVQKDWLTEGDPKVK